MDEVQPIGMIVIKGYADGKVEIQYTGIPKEQLAKVVQLLGTLLDDVTRQ